MDMELGGRGELSKLIAKIESQGGDGYLDEVVYELAARQAMTTNEAGLSTQIEYIVTHLGTGRTKKLLTWMLKKRNSRE